MMSENFVTDIMADLLHAGFTLGMDWPEDGGRHVTFELTNGRVTIPAAWREGLGFAIYLAGPKREGVPHEVFKTPELACRRIKQIAASFDQTGVISPMTIEQMTDLVPALSAQHNGDQSSLGSSGDALDHNRRALAKRVGALGGRLETHVVTDEMDVRVHIETLS